MTAFLDFEKQVAALDRQIAELREMGDDPSLNIDGDIARLEDKSSKMLRDIYAKLTPWQKTQVARHPDRPHFKHYVAGLFDDWMPLAGDRNFGDDQAILGGLARFRGRRVMVIGHEKGDDIPSRMKHNFGMAKPEGYRKAIRLMQLADRFGLPVVTLVDTSGAFPGIQAEERGQAEAIAYNLEAMMGLNVPVVCVVIGEGGSGGALAIGIGNHVHMLEHAVYSVISPEAASAILYREQGRAQQAAEALKPTAQDLKTLGVVDDIIEEPRGGAHKDHVEMAQRLADKVTASLDELSSLSGEELVAQRVARFRQLGRTA